MCEVSEELIQEGKKQGKIEEKLLIIKKLLKRNISIEEISDIVDLSVDEINNILDAHKIENFNIRNSGSESHVSIF